MINKNGDVNYKGFGFVAKDGDHQWKIKPKKIELLVKLLEEFNYREFNYQTDIVCIDSPHCITTVKFLDGTEKEIDHDLGLDKFKNILEKFENTIDKIVGAKKYTFLKYFTI